VRLDTRALVVAALISLITMPITAIWFLVLGGLTLGACGFVGALSTDRRPLGTPIGAGLGLLAGPALYVAFAALR
jgi:hypothetical protein